MFPSLVAYGLGGFFCAVIGRRPGFYTTIAGLFASPRVGVRLFTRLQRATYALSVYGDCTTPFQPVVDRMGAWYMTLI